MNEDKLLYGVFIASEIFKFTSTTGSCSAQELVDYMRVLGLQNITIFTAITILEGAGIIHTDDKTVMTKFKKQEG